MTRSEKHTSNPNWKKMCKSDETYRQIRLWCRKPIPLNGLYLSPWADDVSFWNRQSNNHIHSLRWGEDNFWTFSFITKPLPSLFIHIANIATPWKPWGGNYPKEFTTLSPYCDYKALQNTQNSWKDIVEPVGCSQVEAMLQAFHISFECGHSKQVQTLRLVLNRFPVGLGCVHPPTDQVRCCCVPSLQTLGQSNPFQSRIKELWLTS